VGHWHCFYSSVAQRSSSCTASGSGRLKFKFTANCDSFVNLKIRLQLEDQLEVTNSDPPCRRAAASLPVPVARSGSDSESELAAPLAVNLNFKLNFKLNLVVNLKFTKFNFKLNFKFKLTPSHNLKFKLMNDSESEPSTTTLPALAWLPGVLSCLPVSRG